MPELSVLIPTVGGRDSLLVQVQEAIRREHPTAELLVIRGHSWGMGLNLLAAVAQGEYWSCCCDDTIPQPGWFEAGRAMLDSGSEPASRYFNVDGTPLHAVDEMPHGERLPWCRSFLLTPHIYSEVGPFIDATWYSDWDYSERLIAAGYPILACDGFSFTHLDGDRAWNTPAEDARQRSEYEASHQRQGIA